MNVGNGSLKMAGGWMVAALLAVAGASAQRTKTPSQPAPATVQDVVNARRFSLRDAKGVERATMTCDKNGEPVMALFDHAGKVRAEIGISAGIPRVALADSDGRTRIGIELAANGDPSIILYDPKKVGRVVLGSYEDGSRLVLTDSKDLVRVMVAESVMGCAIGINDANELSRINMSVLPDGKSGFLHIDAKGKPLPIP